MFVCRNKNFQERNFRELGIFCNFATKTLFNFEMELLKAEIFVKRSKIAKITKISALTVSAAHKERENMRMLGSAQKRIVPMHLKEKCASVGY